MVVATGYNGSPKGQPHCDDVGHNLSGGHCVTTVHAEQNVVDQAARLGVKVGGGTVYCYWLPCVVCAGHLINAGIKRVVYVEVYHNSGDSGRMFVSSGVELCQLGIDRKLLAIWVSSAFDLECRVKGEEAS